MIIDLRQLVREANEEKQSPLDAVLPGGYVIGTRITPKTNVTALVSGDLARADQEPNAMLRDLQVRGSQGSSKAQVAYSLLKQASANKTFGQYFTNLTYDEKNDVTTITPVQDIQKAAPDRYVEAILRAAGNVGLTGLEYSGYATNTNRRLFRDIVHIQDGRVMIYDRKTIGTPAKATEKPKKTSEETTPEVK